MRAVDAPETGFGDGATKAEAEADESETARAVAGNEAAAPPWLCGMDRMSTNGTVGVMRLPLRPRGRTEAESSESDSSLSLEEGERAVSGVAGSEDAGRRGTATAGFADCGRGSRAAGMRGGLAAAVGGGSASEEIVTNRVETLSGVVAATACVDFAILGISAVTLAFPYACDRVRLAEAGRPAVNEAAAVAAAAAAGAGRQDAADMGRDRSGAGLNGVALKGRRADSDPATAAAAAGAPADRDTDAKRATSGDDAGVPRDVVVGCCADDSAGDGVIAFLHASS